MLKSQYCKLVFISSLILAYFLLPDNLTLNLGALVWLGFVILFAFSTTCIVRNIKEKITVAATYSTSSISLIASVFGFAAIQVCGVGAPVCGASLGAGVLFTLLPVVLTNFVHENPYVILIGVMGFQIFALSRMKCFGKSKISGCSVEPKN